MFNQLIEEQKKSVEKAFQSRVQYETTVKELLLQTLAKYDKKINESSKELDEMTEILAKLNIVTEKRQQELF